jgi:hypothetical protein
MSRFHPYFTNDGSVGLYSDDFDDIYHSTTGALTEAYEKFILPIDFDWLLSLERINVLDICYGIGYNSKSFLNFISNFKIEYILNFLNLTESNNIINRKNVKYIIHNEGKRNKTTKEDKKTTIKQKIIYIPKNIEFDEFYKIIHNDFVPLIEEFKEIVADKLLSE